VEPLIELNASLRHFEIAVLDVVDVVRLRAPAEEGAYARYGRDQGSGGREAHVNARGTTHDG
jgi:hypothetical protein